MARTSHSFGGVSVGIPAKTLSSEAEDEWQEVDWISLDTGDLSVDGDSFLLVFKPSSASVTSKTMGNLLRASTVADDQRTLVVTTSDPTTSQYRFTFPDRGTAAEFKQVAELVEARLAARRTEAAAHSSGSGDVRGAELASAIQGKYRQQGRWPLTFTGADLYGPSASGDPEVLLGCGVFVLLDPKEEETQKTIGKYSLLFFSEDEGSSRPAKEFAIGPRMVLTRQQPDTEDPDAAAATFSLSIPGQQVHTLSFDQADVASTFARDFRVRSRLMDVSLKTASGKKEADQARRELQELQQQGLGARLRRLICLLVPLLLIAVIARMGHLYSLRPGQEPAVYLQQVQKDVSSVLHNSHTAVMATGAKVCEIAVGAVPPSALQKCISVGGVSEVRECVADLLAYSSI